MMARLSRLRRSERGNVAIICAFSIVPMMIGAGMVVDYSQAARLQTQMNAFADAAALSAVTRPMMRKTAAEAQVQARKVFTSQAAGLRGVEFDPAKLSVQVEEATGATVARRTTVTYSAESLNFFGRILGRRTIAIGGTSRADAADAPNIDFYLLVDTSPSMAIPATSSGIKAMIDATKTQGGGVGCAFACHQTSTSKSDPGNTPVVNGKYVDNYYIAKTQLKLTLRIDLVQTAVKDLTDVAVSTASETGAKYRFAVSKFDVEHSAIQTVPGTPAAAKTAASNLNLLVVCRNNQYVCGVNDNDTDTHFTKAFDGALGMMPKVPGKGTNQSGDSPQAMLFLITDGMRDEMNGGRQIGPIPTSQCTTIKNRGIRIAVLYTDYLYESANDSWSITNVRNKYLEAPDKISPALMQCASPGLFYKVTTGDDISASLAALFQKAVSSAHLTQ